MSGSRCQNAGSPKIGIQTISWGSRIEDINLALSQIGQLSYNGVEFAQSVDVLGPAAELGKMLNEYKLCPIGLAGGSLLSRVEYAQQLDPEYLYTDEWDESGIALALEKGYVVGLHPHIYKSIGSLRTAEECLQKYPQLRLIVDTAHFYLTGDDVIETLKRYEDRVIAVHLKDWTSRFGKSLFRFARGFTELGKGDLRGLLDSVVSHLMKSQYEGWIIVEQDNPNGEPEESARISREWLRARGL